MSRRYLCISCWGMWPAEKLFFTCPDCERGDRQLPAWARGVDPGTGRPMSSLRRPWWRRLFSDRVEAACFRHPEAELRLYCPPKCNAPITRAAEIDRRGAFGIGFAGPSSAGKTLFTLAAIRRLRSAPFDGHKVALFGLGDTEERFGALESSLFAKRLKPEATPNRLTGAEAMNFAWEVAVTENGTATRRRDALVAVSDLAGETWGTPSHESHELLDSYLERLGGVVFLVDGASMADDLGLESSDAWNSEPRPGDRGASDRQWLRWLIERLGARARWVDLALTVSKGDLLWTHPDWSGLEPSSNEGSVVAAELDPVCNNLLLRALEGSGRGDLQDSARMHFRRTRLFIASSLGFRPGPDDVDGADRLRRPPEPRYVETPVLWLLAQRVQNLA